jgi:hypothetical protein
VSGDTPGCRAPEEARRFRVPLAPALSLSPPDTLPVATAAVPVPERVHAVFEMAVISESPL